MISRQWTQYQVFWQVLQCCEESGMYNKKTSRHSCCCLRRWGEAMSLNCGHQWAYFSSPRCYMSMESHGGMILTGKTEELRKTCPNATLSTTNPTWTNLDANLGLCGEMLVANHLSHGLVCRHLSESCFKITWMMELTTNAYSSTVFTNANFLWKCETHMPCQYTSLIMIIS
jgi:hypothetical protein